MGRHALLSLVLALSACIPQPQQQGAFSQPNARTHVERGVRYETGKPTYDELFSQVHRLHSEIASVDDDRRAARQGLATELGLLPATAPVDILRVLQERAATLKKKGVAISVAGTSAKSSGDGASLAQALSTTLSSERAILDSLKKVPDRATAVIGMASSLESSVDRDIDPSKRAEVKEEIAAARKLMDKLRDRAREQTDTSERFTGDLVKAATGASAGPSAAPAKPGATAKPAATTSGKPAATSTAAPPPTGTPPANPPATAAPPPPKPPDDFNP